MLKLGVLFLDIIWQSRGIKITPGAQCGTPGPARVARGVDSSSNEPPSGCVRGQEEEEGREGREEVPAHVAQMVTLQLEGLREERDEGGE
jgi:hypothetical protein